MQRVYPGADATLTFAGVTTGGTYTAKVTDPRGRYIQATASETGGTATVTIADGAWLDGASGFGRVEVMRDNSGAKSVEASEIIRVMPGLKAAESSMGAW